MKSLGCLSLFFVAAACTLLAVIVSVVVGFFRVGYDFITGGSAKAGGRNAAGSRRSGDFSYSDRTEKPRKKTDSARRNGKIFDKSEGEYVDFEEV